HGFIMFGTPYEEQPDAEQTLRFLADHHECVQFLNCSVMNLAKGSPMALAPESHGIRSVRPFEIGEHELDLALYDNFEGSGWGRAGARQYLQRTFLKDEKIRPLHLRTPIHFDSNHSIYFHEQIFGSQGAAHPASGTTRCQTSQLGRGSSSQILAEVPSSSSNESNSTS
ncbi:MAG: hypothetical protein ACI9OJ_002429, partial [Myxococcota bacterium]